MDPGQNVNAERPWRGSREIPGAAISPFERAPGDTIIGVPLRLRRPGDGKEKLFAYRGVECSHDWSAGFTNATEIVQSGGGDEGTCPSIGSTIQTRDAASRAGSSSLPPTASRFGTMAANRSFSS